MLMVMVINMSTEYVLVMYSGLELKPCIKVVDEDLFSQIRMAERFVKSNNYYCEIMERNTFNILYRTDNIGCRMMNHNNFSKLSGVQC